MSPSDMTPGQVSTSSCVPRSTSRIHAHLRSSSKSFSASTPGAATTSAAACSRVKRAVCSRKSTCLSTPPTLVSQRVERSAMLLTWSGVMPSLVVSARTRPPNTSAALKPSRCGHCMMISAACSALQPRSWRRYATKGASWPCTSHSSSSGHTHTMPLMSLTSIPRLMRKSTMGRSAPSTSRPITSGHTHSTRCARYSSLMPSCLRKATTWPAWNSVTAVRKPSGARSSRFWMFCGVSPYALQKSTHLWTVVGTDSR
mmetsp:Transcript_5562/g.13860  ORF Transcript_5562/g.13860 Transcript_5562/m.13860 type:complete len:257 (+) Transcript_5562:1351-2121(+)